MLALSPRSAYSLLWTAILHLNIMVTRSARPSTVGSSAPIRPGNISTMENRKGSGRGSQRAAQSCKRPCQWIQPKRPASATRARQGDEALDFRIQSLESTLRKTETGILETGDTPRLRPRTREKQKHNHPTRESGTRSASFASASRPPQQMPTAKRFPPFPTHHHPHTPGNSQRPSPGRDGPLDTRLRPNRRQVENGHPAKPQIHLQPLRATSPPKHKHHPTTTTATTTTPQLLHPAQLHQPDDERPLQPPHPQPRQWQSQ